MGNQDLLGILREHGPMTMKELREKSGGCVFDSLCRMKKKGIVFQPQKGLWAAATESSVKEVAQRGSLEQLLERCRELQAKGYDMSIEIADYEAKLADHKKQAAA